MKLGIFGDSYADERNIYFEENLSWVNVLRQRGLDVTNYGQSASSVYYSYKLFCEHHHNYDRVVYLVTGGDRVVINCLPGTDKFITYGMIDHLKNNRPEFADRYKEVILAAELYFKYITDYDQDNIYRRLLVEEMRRIRPDGLFIPCFPLTPGINSNAIDLMHFSTEDFHHFGYGFIHSLGAMDRRFCHLNENNNIMLADKIEQWIESNSFSLTKDDYRRPAVNDSKHYFDVANVN